MDLYRMPQSKLDFHVGNIGKYICFGGEIFENFPIYALGKIDNLAENG